MSNSSLNSQKCKSKENKLSINGNDNSDNCSLSLSGGNLQLVKTEETGENEIPLQGPINTISESKIGKEVEVIQNNKGIENVSGIIYTV